METQGQQKFQQIKRYVTKCIFFTLLCWGVGIYLFTWIPGNIFLKIGGVVLGLAGFVMLVGVYGNLRGITRQRLEGRLRVACEFEEAQKGQVPPQE